MASASANSQQAYTYQRPSTTATRSLISDADSKGTETLSSPSSDNAPQVHTTNHYERAAADAAISGSVGGASTISGTDRPGGLGRQQSWDMRDLKRAHHENMFAGQSAAGGHGYTSPTGAQQ